MRRPGRTTDGLLSANHRLIMLLLDRPGVERPGSGALSKLAGLKPKTVNALCRDLEELGVVRICRSKGRENRMEKGNRFSTAWALNFQVPLPAWASNDHVVDNSPPETTRHDTENGAVSSEQGVENGGPNVTCNVRTVHKNVLTSSNDPLRLNGNGGTSQIAKTKLIRALCSILGEEDIEHWRAVAERPNHDLIIKALSATAKKMQLGAINNPAAYFWATLQRMERDHHG